MANANYNYRVVRLPKTQKELKPLLRKYASLRLQALKESPESFFSTFEEESQYSDAKWMEKLQRFDVQTFVCQTYSEATTHGVQRYEDEWIGIISLKGPIPHTEYTKLCSKLHNNQHELDTCWQVYNFYTSPEYRYSGVARLLMTEVSSFVAAQTETLNCIKGPNFLAKAYIRGFVWSNLRPLISSYARYGFVQVGNCTLEDVFRSIQEPFPQSRELKTEDMPEQVCIIETVLARVPKEGKTSWINEIIHKL